MNKVMLIDALFIASFVLFAKTIFGICKFLLRLLKDALNK